MKILLPALSPTMETGNLVKWLVKEGDDVLSGDILAEIETDKATMELESPDDGKIEKILVKEGSENISVNTEIALLSVEGEEIEEKIEKPIESSPPVIPNGADTNTKANNISMGSLLKEQSNSLETKNWSEKEITMREALNQAIEEEMILDKDVFLLGEEVAEYDGAYKVTQGLLDKFGSKRVLDTPISEHGFTGLAIGAAMSGLKPICEFMTFNFSMQAIDQIVNSAAKSLYMSGGEINFLEHELLYKEKSNVPEENDFLIPIGKANLIKEGSDVTIIGFSMSVQRILNALPSIEKLGIKPDIIDLRSIKPLDEDLIYKSVKKTNRVVIVEDGWGNTSFGSHLSYLIQSNCFDYLDSEIIKVSGKDVPMPYAENLEKLALPNTDEITSAVKKVSYTN
jgi:pyruvate dehydrogenase E1 component beta subunit